MSRYIDADLLIAEMSEKHRPNFHEDLKSYHMWIMWYWALKDAPSIDLADYVPKDFHDKTCEAMAKAHQEEIADMVRVVRCKECKYFIDNLTEDDTDEAYDSCRWDWSRKIPTADDFCSYGERREP